MLDPAKLKTPFFAGDVLLRGRRAGTGAARLREIAVVEAALMPAPTAVRVAFSVCAYDSADW